MSATDPRAFAAPFVTPRERAPGPITLYRALRSNPLGMWTRQHFEDLLVVTRTPIGSRVVVSDPEAVKRVLVDNAGNYGKDALQRRMLARITGRSLFSSEGERWRLQRRAVAPAFTPRVVGGMAPGMNAAADAGVGAFRQAGNALVEVSRRLSTIAIDVLSRTVLSKSLPDGCEVVRERCEAFMERVGRIRMFDILGMPAWVPGLEDVRARSITQMIDAHADRVIARFDGSGANRTDERNVLSRLRGAGALDRAEIRDNVSMLVGAGYDTVSAMLTWTLYLLSQSPDVREELEGEADKAPEQISAEHALEGMPVARAVLEEALRLYPPAPFMSRVAFGPDEIAGHRVAAGDVVVTAPWLVHRHRRLWADPDAFRPSRFSPAEREAIPRHAFIPFGAGPRVCIGAAFAMLEGIIVLAKLTRAFRFHFAGSAPPVPVQRVTLRPRDGMPMKVELRV
jgi:cytochrome P450